MKWPRRQIIVTILVLLASASSLLAQWIQDGVLICAEPGDQVGPQIVPDGSGGAIIVWKDFRGGADWDLYAQRVNDQGVVMWEPGGVPICTAPGDFKSFRAVADGNSGAIIAWPEKRTGSNDYLVFAQRIDCTGVVHWTSDGVFIPSIGGVIHRLNPDLTTDGAGGAIITWLHAYHGDYPEPIPWDIRWIIAQKITADGGFPWGPNARQIRSEWEVYSPRIVSDGFGGAVIVWEDFLYGLKVQRINSNGSKLWGSDGILILTPDYSPEIVADGSGGAIIGVSKSQAVQRLDLDGNLLWTPNGISTGVSGNLTTDGSGGAIIGGQYVQRINANGNLLWGPGGIATSANGSVNMNSDGNRGAIIAWADSGLFAQRVAHWGIFSGAVEELRSTRILWGLGDEILYQTMEPGRSLRGVTTAMETLIFMLSM